MVVAPPANTTLLSQRIIVGVCDFAVSNNLQAVISTYALGSCVAVVAYEPHLKVGGILHFMLPQSSISPARAARHPSMFADTGLPHFLRALAGMKVVTNNLRILVAGGASVLAGHDPFRIGERNIGAALALLSQQACKVEHQDTGGTLNRAVHLEINTGQISVQIPQSANRRWSLAAPEV
jgi:chemotaxis protein CheD